jgi:hypothetical protein
MPGVDHREKVEAEGRRRSEMTQSKNPTPALKRPRPAPVERLVRKYLHGNHLLPLRIGRPAAR